jgi:hypothetical protein
VSRRFPAPVPQWVTAAGWCAARQPGVAGALRMLYRGQHVGWLTVAADGWRWHTDGYPRPVSSASAFATWEAAAAALAGTRWARRVAGGKVPAAGFRPAIGAHRPWLPKAPREAVQA